MQRFSPAAPPICRIERWRGYVTSSFLVRTPGGVVESPAFRWWRAADPPDEGDARRAFDDLLDRLVAAGWTEIGRGGAWYAVELTHPALTAAAPVAHEPVPAVEPAPEPPPAPPTPPVVVESRRAPAEPPPAAPLPSASRPRRRLLAAAGVAVATLLAASALVGLAGRDRPTAAAAPAGPTTHHVRSAPPKTPPPKTPAAAPAQPPVQPAHVHVVIEAIGRGSWLEVRRLSGTGSVLYSGVLEPGRKLRFEGRRLWARFGAAANLRILQDGRPVPLQGTYDKLFRPR